MAGNVIEVVLRGKDELSHAFSSAGRNLRNFTLAVTAFTVSAGAFLKAGIEFEKLMSGVSAATEATTKEFQLLEAHARRIGQTTPVSARNAAQGMKLLGQAGFSANEILASTAALIDLTIAGEVDMVQASDIVASAIRGFSLEAKEAGRVVDVLAIGAIKSNTDIAGLAESLKFVIPVAAAAGLQIEEVAAALAILADRGLRGSLAGTNLAFAIQQLLKPETEEAQAAIDRLGLRMFDATGKMTNFESIIRQLGESGAKTSDIMEIFGTRSGRAVLNLVNAGAPLLKEMVDEMHRGVGAGSEFARVMSDNVFTSLKKIANSFEAVQITVFKAFGPQFRQMTDNVIIPLIKQLNDWLDVNRELISSRIGEFLNNTSERIRLIAKDAQEGTGFLGLFLGVLGKFVSGLTSLGRAYGQLPRIIQEVGIIFAILGGKLGKVIILGSAGLLLLESFSKKIQEIGKEMQELRKSQGVNDPIGAAFTDSLIKVAQALDRLLGIPSSVGNEFDNLTQTFHHMQLEAEAVPNVMGEMDAAFRSLSGRVQELRPSVEAAQNTFAQLFEGIREGVKKGVDAIGSFKTIGFSLGKDIVEATRTGLSGSLFKVFKGETDKIKDVWNAFLDDLLRSFTKAIADMIIIAARDKILEPLLSKGAGLLSGFFGFATGGLVKKPTLGILGEAGPELVIPLNLVGEFIKGSIVEAAKTAAFEEAAAAFATSEAGVAASAAGVGDVTAASAGTAAAGVTGAIMSAVLFFFMDAIKHGEGTRAIGSLLLGRGGHQGLIPKGLGALGLGAFRGGRSDPHAAGLANVESIRQRFGEAAEALGGLPFTAQQLIDFTGGNPFTALSILQEQGAFLGGVGGDAAGRFVTGPSLRLIGEAGSEHILNVDSPASIRALRAGLEPIMNNIGGAGSITVNIFNPTVRSDDDLRQLVDRVSEELGRRLDIGRRMFLRA